MARKGYNWTKTKFFFHDGDLYKTLLINRPADVLYAWSFVDRKRVTFVYSHVKRTRGKAYHTGQVAEMLNRSPDRLEQMIKNDSIPEPARAYTLDGLYKPTVHLWSDADILNAHEYLLSVHRGRARKDGIVRPYAMPTRSELRAMLTHDVVYYVKDGEGNTIKAFKEQDW
jgi:hypothetical protein